MLRLHRINFVDARNLLRKRAKAGENKATLAREFAISRETLYQYLRA
jgi:DNA-binding XRE family transcriptional regulator